MTTNNLRGAGEHAADNTIKGTLSNGATLYQDILLVDENGDQVTGVGSDTFQLQFRKERDSDTADLTLSTTAGTLTITEGATTTILGLRAAQSVVSDMVGDYFVDLVSKAASDSRLRHRGHGTMTWLDEPIAF